MTKEILLKNFEDLNKFGRITAKTPFDITAKQYRYVVDGRSVMGMFSLNLTAPVTIEYDSEDDKAIEQFEKEIAEFLH